MANRKYGTLQLRILEEMDHYDEMNRGYWRQMLYFPERLGSLRPAIHRALKRLIKDGLVIKRYYVSESTQSGQLNKRATEYMLANRQEDQVIQDEAERVRKNTPEYNEYIANIMRKCFGRNN